jgi:hypothetical protein
MKEVRLSCGIPEGFAATPGYYYGPDCAGCLAGLSVDPDGSQFRVRPGIYGIGNSLQSIIDTLLAAINGANPSPQY